MSGCQRIDNYGRAVITVSAEDLKDTLGQSRTGILRIANVHAFYADDNNINVGSMELPSENQSLMEWTQLDRDITGKSAAYTLVPGTNPTFPYKVVDILPSLNGAATETNSRMEIHINNFLYDVNGVTQETVEQNKLEYNFRRGDANGNGTVNITDALYIAQYLARLRVVGEGSGQIRAVNAASVRHDEGLGDKITIHDMMHCSLLSI